ncbi:hypothetical protein B0J11DRAFT_202806 [Dendryphion nanum]|uniref:Uncharacterized protein n=1 Tax=Dendryphion nanum TaxID=256645 RepID=A0A9P9D009_9PLEO|nr:hypothetical protein B0J11DRAFT_202806 [Dendryphion nanum]
MFSSRFHRFSAFAALLSLTTGDVNSVCYSYGVDFVDEGHYFINSQSTESFTCVSTFKGCNPDIAEVLIVDPNGDEHICSQVQTTPADDPKLSTCPILKNQMQSGAWIILVIGNNDDGFPFAWQRDLVLDVGPQATTTFTPTATFNVTSTPTITATSTQTQTIVSTTGPFSTVTIPSATAKYTKTIVPPAVTTSITKTFTRSSISTTRNLVITTKTVTATCTIPKPGRPDKPCRYSPTRIHPAAIVTPTGTARPNSKRIMRNGKTDRAVDYAYARGRIEAAKARRDALAQPAAARLQERAPDAPTLTITDPTPIKTTVTFTAPAITTTESVLVTTTSTSTLPPATVFSGVYTATTTLPPQTRTRYSFLYTTVSSTKTISATWTYTTTVTPTASITACKSAGGHIGPVRRK